MVRSVYDLLCCFWMVGPPMCPTLKTAVGQLDCALQDFARLHLMARSPEPDPTECRTGYGKEGEEPSPIRRGSLLVLDFLCRNKLSWPFTVFPFSGIPAQRLPLQPRLCWLYNSSNMGTFLQPSSFCPVVLATAGASRRSM